LTDNRSTIEQVKSGFRIVGAFLTSFAAWVLFTIGYIDVIKPENQKVSLGLTLLLVTIITMLLTVRFWANWFGGVASSLALRSTLLIFFTKKGGMSPWNAIGLTISFWCIAFLSIKFYKKRQFSHLDQLSITAAAVCLFWGFARLGTAGDNAMLIPVACGLPLLVIAAYKKPLKVLLHRFS
jgi:prolipoprotein diacylglyceryltransferase